jgi:hypothetical protein
MIVGINSKALQLSNLLLPQYQSKLAHILKGPEDCPLPGTDIEIKIDAEVITSIIASIIKLGEQWLAENPSNNTEKTRDDLRQK